MDNNCKECENCHVFNFKIMDIKNRPPKTLGSCNYYTNQKDKSKCAGVQIHILREQLLAEQAKNKKLVENMQSAVNNLVIARNDKCANIDCKYCINKSGCFMGKALITLIQALNEVNK